MAGAVADAQQAGSYPIVFLLGPSGAGKSTVGRWLADDAHLLWMEIDRYPEGDGIDLAGLRAEWDRLYLRGESRPMADELRRRIAAQDRRGAVLSFPSLVTFGTGQMDAMRREGITTVILYASEAECRAGFVEHEQHAPRVRADLMQHWTDNNRASFDRFGRPECAALRLMTYSGERRRTRKELVREILNRLTR